MSKYIVLQASQKLGVCVCTSSHYYSSKSYILESQKRFFSLALHYSTVGTVSCAALDHYIQQQNLIKCNCVLGLENGHLQYFKLSTNGPHFPYKVHIKTYLSLMNGFSSRYFE